jgi:hypothetical protein
MSTLFAHAGEGSRRPLSPNCRQTAQSSLLKAEFSPAELRGFEPRADPPEIDADLATAPAVVTLTGTAVRYARRRGAETGR